jgi:hypothetical protein
MHSSRRWGVGPVIDAQDLARKLTERTWTLCTGFFVAGHEEYLFLNDATSEDSAGESITFSWCTFENYGELSIMQIWLDFSRYLSAILAVSAA